MLTCQVKRAWQIADIYRKRGIKVILGGIATMLHAKEMMQHGDAVFLVAVNSLFSRQLGIVQDFDQALSIKSGWRSNTGKAAECRIDVDCFC